MFNNENIQLLSALLVKKKQTVSVAESVTSGFIQAAFSIAENASQFYQGGLTAYNLQQKYRHLGVDIKDGAANNCVSEQIAKQMAFAIRVQFFSDWGIGITGYASPIPGHDQRKLFAWFAIVYHDVCLKSITVEADKGSPIDVQIVYTDKVLQSFIEILKSRE